MQTHLSEDDLVLHYYGETDSGDEGRAADHLAECEPCHASYTRLQRVLAAVEAAPGPEIAEGFERTVWARLEPSLHPSSGWLSWFVFSPARLVWSAAILALVTASFFAGRGWDRGVSGGPDTAAMASGMRERILLVDLGEHLDRSQTMLVDLVSAGGDGAVDISVERTRAEQLVEANRLYRQTAAAAGDGAIVDLLDELERVLVDIAASPGELSSVEMAEVRQRIDTAGLLFKVRVMSSQVRDRQKSAMRIRTGQSS
jgi:hypothetical protein